MACTEGKKNSIIKVHRQNFFQDKHIQIGDNFLQIFAFTSIINVIGVVHVLFGQVFILAQYKLVAWLTILKINYWYNFEI
jgi:hypothetical protein